MPKLTELYKRLSELEEEIEEAVEWVEGSANTAKLTVAVSTLSEGRAHHIPYWMKQDLEGKFRKALLENVRAIIEEKVQEKNALETRFIQEVSRGQDKTSVDQPMTRVDAAIQRGG